MEGHYNYRFEVLLMPTSRDLGLLALRVGVGATMAAHGTQKLFGWFGGGGIEGTGAVFESMGFKPGKVNALVAGVTEVGSGALLVAGAATPAAGAAAAGTMVVASAIHVPNGFFAQKGGYEYAAMLGLAASALALTGPGTYSFDGATHNALNKPWMKAVALGAVVPASAYVLMKRKQALAAAASNTAAHDEATTSD